jgi:hypothetical protein
VAKYLSPTPESFYELLKLLQFERIYRSPVYDDYWTLLTNPGERNLIMMPRGSYKSTCLVAACIRWILLDPNVRILYASETYSNAKKYLAQIRRQFESNNDLRQIFGDLVGNPWREEEFTVAGRTDLSKKEGTVTAAGIDVTKTGMHYDIIIVDDPVSRENTRTALTIEHVIDWYKLLLSIAEEGTIVIVNGTPYEDTDLYTYIQGVSVELQKKAAEGQPGKTYKTFIRSAIDAEGKAVYVNPNFTVGMDPELEHLTLGILASLRIELGPRRFSSQYLLDPVPREYALFKREQFKLVPVHQIPPAEMMNIYMLTDTASSEDREDDTVLAILGVDVLINAWILAMRLGQWKPAEVVQNIVSMYVRWNCKRVLMEKIATNEIYGTMLGAWSVENQIRINIVPVGGRTMESKAMRIESLQGRFVSGKIFFSAGIDQELIRSENGICYGKIVEEFIRFAPNRKAKDDIPDCLSDMDKTDSGGPNGARLCPPPKLRRPPPKPTMVNGQFSGLPQKPVTSGGNFWGDLAKQVGRK